jgi:hypothetical protein
MTGKRARTGRVKRYSYGRIAGNYLKLFSLPGRIIIVFILIGSIIFFKAVF